MFRFYHSSVCFLINRFCDTIDFRTFSRTTGYQYVEHICQCPIVGTGVSCFHGNKINLNLTVTRLYDKCKFEPKYKYPSSNHGGHCQDWPLLTSTLARRANVYTLFLNVCGCTGGIDYDLYGLLVECPECNINYIVRKIVKI